MRRLARTFLVAGLLLVTARPAGATEFFLPGNEGAVLELLRPYSDETLVLGDWSLEALELGPACELRLAFVAAGTDARVTARVVPGDREGRGLGFRWKPERPGALGDALEALVRGNAPGDFFRERCRGDVDPVTGVTGDPEPAPFIEAAFRLPEGLEAPRVEGKESGALADVISTWNRGAAVLLWVLVLGAAMTALILLGRGRGRGVVVPQVPRLRDEPSWVRWVFSAGLLVRLVAAWVSPSFLVESTQFIGLGDAYDLVGGRLPVFSFGTLFGESISYHLPLIDLLIGPWMSLGDLLGLGGHLLWLRLPTLAASGVIMWLLLRTGRHLGAPGAGRIALVLFAFLPACVRVSVTTTHYLMEMAAAAWVLERAVAATFGGRPCYRSLAVAAAAACWSGFVAWALVAIVGLGVVGSMVRRGHVRETALVALFVAALVAPLANTAWDTLGATVDRSVPLVEGQAPADSSFAVPPMFQPVKIDALQVPEPLVFPWHMAIHLLDALSALLALAGLALALALRPRLAPVVLGLLTAYGLARLQLQLSHDNLALLFPLFLLLPALGADALRDRLPARRWIRWVAPGWAALALAGVGVATDQGDHVRYWEGGGRYYHHQARRAILGENVHELRRRIGDLSARTDAVLLLPERPFHFHAAVCDGLPDVGAMERCLSREWSVDAHVSTEEMSPEWAAGLREEGSLDGRPVALLLGPDRSQLPLLVAELGRSCDLLVETPMLSLLSCPVPGAEEG